MKLLGFWVSHAAEILSSKGVTCVGGIINSLYYAVMLKYDWDKEDYFWNPKFPLVFLLSTIVIQDNEKIKLIW